ncbi:MAG TPA: HD domain-containing phosphohydrolase [Solirubrobacteraceae bacterium]|nr:HD domain-containing phosphohydrolase [Solirubrobacteraceae bacterium]
MQRSTQPGVSLAQALVSDPPPETAETAEPASRRLFGLLSSAPDEGVVAAHPVAQTGDPGSQDGSRRRRRAPGRGLLLFAAATAGVGALLADGPIFTALGALLLALLALLTGWKLGEHRRLALQAELDERGDDLRRALSELEIAQAETVRRLSMAVEFRDEDTGAHIERIGRFSTLLARAVGMSLEFCRRISHAAPLHDVGKVAIPDAILLKPGSLTPEERAIVETHAEEGHRLLRGSSSSILDMGAAIALSHHERWDGGGYPRGLAAEKIPIEGRIVAIADVFDALTSHRVYRDAFSVEQAREMMLAESGKHFDPVLLQTFMEVLDTSGVDARARERSDPSSLVAGALEIYTDAMRLGDAELAEQAIAQAIEDGIDPSRLKDEVIAPVMRHVQELRDGGEIDVEVARRADAITGRVMATMNRYLLARG